MKRGDIWLIELPFREGKEQRGVRPGIILADSTAGMIVTIPITSHQEALRFPHTIKIKKSSVNNLDKDSVVLLFQIQSLDKKRFIHKLGDLEGEMMDHIDAHLKEFLHL